MAKITEEPETSHQQTIKNQSLRSKPQKSTAKPNSQTQYSNPFIFWFYLTLIVSIITFLTLSFTSLNHSSDPKSFFLSLSTPLRNHYSKGRTIKVQLGQSQPQVEVFTLESGDNKGLVSENVVIVHGFGLNSYSYGKVVDFLGSRGVHGVVFDIPGSGFSDNTVEVFEERGNGALGRFKDAYDLISEKGVFWAFDTMVETGQVPYEEINSHFDKKKRVLKPIELGSYEMGKVLGQVIGTMGLAPVHLVLHDSSLSLVANWVLENPGLVRSLTLVDTGSRPALPTWILKMPVVREIVLGSNFVYNRVVNLCCSRGIGGVDLEAHRVMLKGRDGRRAVVQLNSSFDVAEWGGLDGIKGIPMQVIWSGGWSEEWSKEGKVIAEGLPQAKFATHSGGRWPQEDAADELAESIVTFVTSLPASVRSVEEEPIPEHIQKLVDEAKEDPHHDDHHHHGHDHHGGHAHPGMDAYGLGHGWAS